MKQIETVFDMESRELADKLREAADAVEQGGATAFMFDRHGDVDDGPIYNTVFIKYMTFEEDNV